MQCFLVNSFWAWIYKTVGLDFVHLSKQHVNMKCKGSLISINNNIDESGLIGLPGNPTYKQNFSIKFMLCWCEAF